MAAWSVLWHWTTEPPLRSTPWQPHRGFSQERANICFWSIYFPQTRSSEHENQRFRTHILSLNPCLPIGHLPNVVELSTRRLGAQNSPRTRADLTAHRRGSHAHAPPQVVGHDCEPALTLAVTLDRKGAGGLRREVKGRQHRIPMQPAQSAHIYAYEPRSSCADLPLRLRLLGVFQCSIHGRTGDPKLSR